MTGGRRSTAGPWPRPVIGVVLGMVGLPLLTSLLTHARDTLSLPSEVLLYLLAVVIISMLGGLVVAIASAVVASQLLNYYFTPPLHTFAIDKRDHLLALGVFVLVALAVSVLVEQAARRGVRLAEQAAHARELTAADTMRTALLAAVGHDLRTPLAGVKAAVTSLRQDDVAWTPSETAELLATIEESADRLTGLVANLLDMSRLQAGALSVHLRPVALDEVVPAALGDLAYGDLSYGSGGATAVGIEVAEALPMVLADSGLLERVVANLVQNALRYAADQSVLVTARRIADQIELAVVDHGPGIPVTAREQVFAAFQRLGDSAGTGGVGVGLGLAVARGFVTAMGGTLVAAETQGGGLTMTVALPVAATDLPAVAGPPAVTGPPAVASPARAPAPASAAAPASAGSAP